MSLTRPRITVEGATRWPDELVRIRRRRSHAQAQARAREGEPVMSLSELRMIGGTITVTEAARGISEELSDVELSFAWPSIARSFGATGRFTWRGEVFDASANAGDLLAALSGDRSGLKLRLAGAPFKLAFEGAMSRSPRSRWRARSPSMANRCARRCAGPTASPCPAPAWARSRSRRRRPSPAARRSCRA